MKVFTTPFDSQHELAWVWNTEVAYGRFCNPLTDAGCDPRRQAQFYPPTEGSRILDGIRIGITVLTLLAIVATYRIHSLALGEQVLRNLMPQGSTLLGTSRRWAFFAEVLLVAVHVFPSIEQAVPDDPGLYIFCCLFMFARIGFATRVGRYYSRLNTSNGRFVSALTNVEFGGSFIFKTVLKEHPVELMLSSLVLLLFVSGYAVRMVESLECAHDLSLDCYPMTLADALWLVVITALTVGFGDVVPSTDGGRFLAITGGLAGTLITALTIALTTEYLQLSRSESKVVSFLQRHKLRQTVQNQAAIAIQTAFRLRQSLRERGRLPPVGGASGAGSQGGQGDRKDGEGGAGSSSVLQMSGPGGSSARVAPEGQGHGQGQGQGQEGESHQQRRRPPALDLEGGGGGASAGGRPLAGRESKQVTSNAALPTAGSEAGRLSQLDRSSAMSAANRRGSSSTTGSVTGRGGAAAGGSWWQPSCMYQTVDPSTLESVLYERLDSFRQVRRFAHSHDPGDPTDKQLTLLETLDVNLQDVRANTEVIIEWLVGTGDEEGEGEAAAGLGVAPGAGLLGVLNAGPGASNEVQLPGAAAAAAGSSTGAREPVAVRNLAQGAPLGTDVPRPGGMGAGSQAQNQAGLPGGQKQALSREQASSRRSIGSRRSGVSGGNSTSRLRSHENREHLMGVLDRRRRLSHANKIARQSGEVLYGDATGRGISPTLPLGDASYQSAESQDASQQQQQGSAALLGPLMPRHGSTSQDSSLLDEVGAGPQGTSSSGAAAVMERQRADADARKMQDKELNRFVAKSAAAIGSKPRDRLAASSLGKKGPSMRGVLSLDHKQDSGGSGTPSVSVAGTTPSNVGSEAGDRPGTLGFLAQMRGADRGSGGGPMEQQFRASQKRLLEVEAREGKGVGGRLAQGKGAVYGGQGYGGRGTPGEHGRAVGMTMTAGDSIGSDGGLHRVGTAGDGLFTMASATDVKQGEGAAGGPAPGGESEQVAAMGRALQLLLGKVQSLSTQLLDAQAQLRSTIETHAERIAKLEELAGGQGNGREHGREHGRGKGRGSGGSPGGDRRKPQPPRKKRPPAPPRGSPGNGNNSMPQQSQHGVADASRTASGDSPLDTSQSPMDARGHAASVGHPGGGRQRGGFDGSRSGQGQGQGQGQPVHGWSEGKRGSSETETETKVHAEGEERDRRTAGGGSHGRKETGDQDEGEGEEAGGSMQSMSRRVAADSPPAEFDTLLGAFEGILQSDAGIEDEDMKEADEGRDGGGVGVGGSPMVASSASRVGGSGAPGRGGGSSSQKQRQDSLDDRVAALVLGAEVEDSSGDERQTANASGHVAAAGTGDGFAAARDVKGTPPPRVPGGLPSRQDTSPSAAVVKLPPIGTPPS